MIATVAHTATSAARAGSNDTVSALGRVEPQLRELVGLATVAGALPSWSRAIRARSAGQFLSTLRGRGMEYDESRPYQPGDDIRHLDWRVTARTGRPHTKLFREERERPILICVDYRRAMFFATRGVFKAVQAARTASVLAWRAQQNGDRVGGLIITDTGFCELPPRRGKTATMQWLKLLVAEAPRQRAASAPTGVMHTLNDALTRLQRVVKPGSLLFIISDFRSFNADTAATLAQMGQHSDIGLIAVHDPLEAQFPEFEGSAALADGKRTLRLAGIGRRERASYAAQFAARIDQVRKLGREHRLLFAQIDTASDPIGPLIKMFGG